MDLPLAVESESASVHRNESEYTFAGPPRSGSANGTLLSSARIDVRFFPFPPPVLAAGRSTQLPGKATKQEGRNRAACLLANLILHTARLTFRGRRVRAQMQGPAPVPARS